MPTFKLTYFDVRYRPEISRLLFVASGTEFEDDRLTGEEFGKLKGSGRTEFEDVKLADMKEFYKVKDAGKLPLGQVPILETTNPDRLIIQSRAIQRYVARECGFYGSSNDEATTIDEITETCDELLDDAAPWLYREKDPEKLAKLKDVYLKEQGPRRLKYLEAKVSDSGYFVGSALTMADLAMFNMLDILNDRMPEVIQGYPKLQALMDKVKSNEKIAKYLETRPKTSM